jgi:hypothetical protein
MNIRMILRTCVAAATACAFVSPELAQASSLGQTVSRSVARKLLQKAPAGKPRDVLIRRSQHPQAAAHIDAAQRNGQPTVLHIDRKGAPNQRKQSTGTVHRNPKPSPGYERDEYPPAMTREGGSGSNVRFIDPHDNRGAGARIRAQTSDLPDGAKIRVLVTD